MFAFSCITVLASWSSMTLITFSCLTKIACKVIVSRISLHLIRSIAKTLQAKQRQSQSLFRLTLLAELLQLVASPSCWCINYWQSVSQHNVWTQVPEEGEGPWFSGWAAETFEVEDGKRLYTQKSDLWQVGKLMEVWEHEATTFLGPHAQGLKECLLSKAKKTAEYLDDSIFGQWNNSFDSRQCLKCSMYIIQVKCSIISIHFC